MHLGFNRRNVFGSARIGVQFLRPFRMEYSAAPFQTATPERLGDVLDNHQSFVGEDVITNA